MDRYKSFILKENRFERGDFVLVANEATTQERKNNAGDTAQITDESSRFWIAYILEVRAASKNRVFVRVYWMYRPDELPPGTFSGKKFIQGRQPYHGRNELVASNHMDVINVQCVEAPASVKQWMGSSDDELDSDFICSSQCSSGSIVPTVGGNWKETLDSFIDALRYQDTELSSDFLGSHETAYDHVFRIFLNPKCNCGHGSGLNEPEHTRSLQESVRYLQDSLPPLSMAFGEAGSYDPGDFFRQWKDFLANKSSRFQK
ncbi:hypothetical protein CEP52_017499, partial [Fusarium oligoseptatum]